MNIKHGKQRQYDDVQIRQNLKKMKKQKNPYNINISFNINNPKKVISNQFNKTIKIHNYNNLNHDANIVRSNKQHVSNPLHSMGKYNSTTLPKSKQHTKYECYLENNESLINSKKNKKSKNKNEDHETKSRSDFNYNTSILSMPFDGDDPMPSSAVKKLNKMKKYFLEKIGSMDITVTDHHLDSKPYEQKNLKYPNPKYEHQPKQSQFKNHKQQDDIMTEKLSQYQYENLISYENQNSKGHESSSLNSFLRSNQIFLQEEPDKFPQKIIESINSVSMKNEYLKNHSKFIDQNMAIFSKSGENKMHKKSKGNIKNNSLEDFSLFALRSKFLQQNSSQNGSRKQKKQEPKQSKSDKGISESKKMKEKIQIMQDLLLRNESSRSILPNDNVKMKKISEDSEFERKNLKLKEAQKSYVIKTQIQLSADIINEIKTFQSQKLKQQLENVQPQSNNRMQKNEKLSFQQFLNNRSRQSQCKQTKNLIQTYINLLSERISDSRKMIQSDFLENVSNYESILKQPSSSDEIHYLSSINDQGIQSSVQERIQISKLPFNLIHQGSFELNQSPIPSYMGEGSQKINQKQLFNHYSQQRQEKAQIENKIKDDFFKKIQKSTLQGLQSTNKNIDENQQKTQNKLSSDIPQNLQFSSLLGFIQQKITFQETDKKVLEDLYNKLTGITKVQNLQSNNQLVLIDSYQSVSNQIKSVAENLQKLQIIKTPSKGKNIFKSNKLHRRSYSTQKYSNNVQQMFATSDDLNYWDLILVEQKLNKKYNEISHEKQKILFSIESDETLNEVQCQNKINQLEEWQNEAKRQILKIKRQIKTGMQRLKNLFTPSQDAFGFKMKSFSQKRIFKNVQTKRIEDLPNPSKISQKVNKEKFSSECSQNLINESSSMEMNPDDVFKQVSTKQVEKQAIFIESQSSDITQETQVPRIDLFRTNNRTNLHEKTPESALNSESSDSDLYYEKQINSDDISQDEKKLFIDYVNIEKSRPGDFNEPQINSITNIKGFSPTEQDKLDICEFILLDLCIQLYQDSLDLEEYHIKKGKYHNNGPKRIIKDIFNFIKNQKKKPKKKGPKIGIHTQLSTVKEYVEKIKSFIENLEEKTALTTQSSNQRLIIDRINVPIGPTAAQILKSMRFQEHEAFQSHEEQAVMQNSQLDCLVLPVYVFTDFEEKIQNDKEFVFDKYFDDFEKQKNRLAFLKNVTHVHHKAMFDSLNEMLDIQRPFGIWGKPFPWKNKNDREKSSNRDKLKVSLAHSCGKVVQCAMYMCGLLVDKEQSLIKGTSVSECYIEEVKQDRMSKMIINEFLQTESRFYFFDDEETEILLETSYVVWAILLQQILIEIQGISQRII